MSVSQTDLQMGELCDLSFFDSFRLTFPINLQLLEVKFCEDNKYILHQLESVKEILSEAMTELAPALSYSIRRINLFVKNLLEEYTIMSERN